MTKWLMVLLCITYNWTSFANGQCKPSTQKADSTIQCPSPGDPPGTSQGTRFRNYQITWPDGFQLNKSTSLTYKCAQENFCCIGGSGTLETLWAWQDPVESENGNWSVTGNDGKITWPTVDCTWPCSDIQAPQGGIVTPPHSWSASHQCSGGAQCEVDCNNCTTSFCDGEGCCMEGTPILVSARGNQLTLTDVDNGVNFDLDSDGIPELMAWTTAGADAAFLVLDRNGNGVIDDGTELFGDFTPQPFTAAANRNGFNALAVFDTPKEGGNGDGKIDSQDAVFSQLALWTDLDHDGISDAGEVRLASTAHIEAFRLRYQDSRRTDQYGNQFKYISVVDMAAPPGPVRKFAVDVVFTRE